MKFLQSFQRSIDSQSSVSSLKRNQLLLDSSIVLIFWTILFFLGYPDPNIDDLFFIGAGINLAKGGEFINPLLENWNQAFTSGKYYYHFPYYSYIIAFWLKLFGISAKSFSFYQTLNSIIFSISTILILKGFGFQRFLYVPIIILFAIWMNYSGLRPECTGLALLSLGLLFLTKDKPICYFLGFFFVTASFLSSTLVVFAYGISFTISILLINFLRFSHSQDHNIYYIKTRFMSIFLAFLVNILIFLVLIEFDINSWLTDFLHHVSLRRTPFPQSFYHFLEKMTFAWNKFLLLPSYLLFTILCIGYFFIFKKHLFKKYLIVYTTLLISLITGIILNIIIYSSALKYADFFVSIGILCIAAKMSDSFRIKKSVFLFSLGVIFSSQSLTMIYLGQRGYHSNAYYSEVNTKVTQMAKPNKYVIDSVAAKFVFDYNMPQDSIDWIFMVPNRERPAKNDKKANDLWILSKADVEKWIPEFRTDYPKIAIFNKEFGSLAKDPFEIIILR